MDEEENYVGYENVNREGMVQVILENCVLPGMLVFALLAMVGLIQSKFRDDLQMC